MERNALWHGLVKLYPQKQNLNFVGAVFFICVLTLAVFWPSFSNDFQRAWDDQWMVLDHPMILDQSVDNLWYYFTNYDRGQYFPLNQLYYIAIFNLFGFNALAFHAGSIVLHLINATLVLVLLQKLCSLAGFQSRLSQVCVLLITIIFAIHPLQVESVAWISASKVLLYSTFTLAGLVAYVVFKSTRNYIYLALTFLGYCFSLMVKEQAIILPLNVVLIDLFFHSFGVRKFTTWVWIDKIPLFGLALLFWYWSTQNDLGLLNPEWAYSWDQRLVFGSYSLIVYVVRFILPTKLLFYYGFPILAGEELSWVYYGYIFVATFMLMYVIDLYRQRKFVPFFGLLFFLINILLVLHIFPMPRAMITADRYMYLSILGLTIWALWGIHHLFLWSVQQKRVKNAWKGKIIVSGVISLYLIGFGLYSNNLTRKWNDSTSIKKELKEFVVPGVNKKSKEG